MAHLCSSASLIREPTEASPCSHALSRFRRAACEHVLARSPEHRQNDRMGRQPMIVEGLDAEVVVPGHLLDCEHGWRSEFAHGIHSYHGTGNAVSSIRGS